MNLEIQHILSNPILLKDVPNETLQQWINKYPYVPIFHLYALKKNLHYTDNELQKTAFYLNNREGLYKLLKQNESEITKTSNSFLQHQQSKTTEDKSNVNNCNKSSIITEETINNVEKDNLSTKENIDENNDEIETSKQDIEEIKIEENKIENTILEEEKVVIKEVEKEVLEEIDKDISEKDTTEIKVTEPINVINQITVPNSNVEQKPLSIADKIMEEIRLLKEERARKVLSENESESESESETKIEEKSTEKILEKNIENIVEDNLSENKNEIISETKDDKIVEVLKIDEPITETEKALETSTNIDTKTISIQDEIIARINKIKEDRENKVLSESKNKNESESESENESIIKEKLEENTEDIVEENLNEDKNEAIIEENKISETIIESVETPATSTNIDIKTISIQDEIIARINKIKEDREKKILSESENKNESESESEEKSKENISEGNTEDIVEKNLSEDKNEAIIEDIKIAEPITETEKTVETSTNIDDETSSKVHEIKITEQIVRFNEKNINTEQTESTIENKKEIQFIDEEAKPKIEQDKRFEIAISTPVNKVDDILDFNQFGDAYKEPLIVHILPVLPNKTNYIEPIIDEQKEDKITIVENTSTPKTIIKEDEKSVAIEEKNNNAKEEIQVEKIPTFEKKEIIEPVKEDEKIVLNKALTQAEPEIIQEGKKDNEEKIIEPVKVVEKIVIDKALTQVEPEIKEEEKTEEKIIESVKVEKKVEIKSIPKLDEENIKEPHTFVEWLKLLDGNLQIQTTELPIEKEWIEIPKYEVQQTLANKKQIQEEENKIFTPNFEEGEIDLFNEIDEEVTKVANESVSFKQDMMTETLAKIYSKQGKIDKALEIYNALSLKFPEKSSYFATLIKNLQK